MPMTLITTERRSRRCSHRWTGGWHSEKVEAFKDRWKWNVERKFFFRQLKLLEEVSLDKRVCLKMITLRCRFCRTIGAKAECYWEKSCKSPWT